MQNTFNIFDDRSEEIELYYSIILELDSGNNIIQTINDRRFLKILKSNLLLMLYNLIEACIVSGMLEIYEKLKADTCAYNDVISEIQKIWSNYQISQIYGPTTVKLTYEKKVQNIIHSIFAKEPIELTKGVLNISGNLDAQKIKKLCDIHRIRYAANDDIGALKVIKDRRNSLAHGDVSFSECARDLAVGDLEGIKNGTLKFIKDILHGMEKYYNNQEYKI